MLIFVVGVKIIVEIIIRRNMVEMVKLWGVLWLRVEIIYDDVWSFFSFIDFIEF